MTEENGKFVISSDSCPIGVAVAVDVRACSTMQALLQELMGLSVAKECLYGTRSKCRFVITPQKPRGRRGGASR